MNSEELKGLELFNSDRTNCSTCHSGFNFTNYKFENNGLYESYEDPGRYRLTLNEADRALFKIPSLRNVEKTAPYMIDGSVSTLEEVIEHYNSGGKNHPHKSPLVRPLNLTSSEKASLVAFLKTLTDDEFLQNPNFKK
jgi:cytochrome c peroxidase